jgi:hypothetical protein
VNTVQKRIKYFKEDLGIMMGEKYEEKINTK